MRINEDIEVKYNLSLTARERGKIVDQRLTHNIFVDLGREWLAQLISYLSFSPDLTETDYRVKYMGLGIGGTRQTSTAVASAVPISPPYTGSNTQTDTDRTVTRLERPVRVVGSTSVYPGLAGDRWIGLIQAPAVHPTAQRTEFRRVFTANEVSYPPFLGVPLSEIGLFTAAANPENYKNNLIAYDTFDTITKTTAVELEVIWTFIFG
mgnify:CR=1 FL=1